jgi:hypothetical protein
MRADRPLPSDSLDEGRRTQSAAAAHRDQADLLLVSLQLEPGEDHAARPSLKRRVRWCPPTHQPTTLRLRFDRTGRPSADAERMWAAACFPTPSPSCHRHLPTRRRRARPEQRNTAPCGAFSRRAATSSPVIPDQSRDLAVGIARGDDLPRAGLDIAAWFGRERAAGDALDEHGLSHASGDAHRFDAMLAVERFEITEQGGHDAPTPVIPNGCPRAIAPPNGLSLSAGILGFNGGKDDRR